MIVEAAGTALPQGMVGGMGGHPHEFGQYLALLADTPGRRSAKATMPAGMSATRRNPSASTRASSITTRPPCPNIESCGSLARSSANTVLDYGERRPA